MTIRKMGWTLGATAVLLLGCGNGKLGEKHTLEADGAVPADGGGQQVGMVRIALGNRTPCPIAPQGQLAVGVALFEQALDLVVNPKTGLLEPRETHPFDVRKTIGPCLVTAPNSLPPATGLDLGPGIVTAQVGSGPVQEVPPWENKATHEKGYSLTIEPAPPAGTPITVTVKLPGAAPLVRTLKLIEPLDFTAPAMKPSRPDMPDLNVYYVAHDEGQALTLSWSPAAGTTWTGSIHNYTSWLDETGDGGETLRCFAGYADGQITIPAAALQYDIHDTGPYFTFNHGETEIEQGPVQVIRFQNAMSRTFRLLGPQSPIWSWAQ